METGSPSNEICGAPSHHLDHDHDGLVDCVVLDAPCSGFGTLRRNPEHRSEADGERLPTLHGTMSEAKLGRARPASIYVAQAAGWPRLAEAPGSLGRDLALEGASGEPAGRGLIEA